MEFGIVLYDIEKDGNLNGVYTNNVVKGKIFTETARLKSKKNNVSTYDFFYFDIEDTYTGKLTITEKDGVLDCTWNVYEINDGKGGDLFTGQGFKMNERQIAIYYKGV